MSLQRMESNFNKHTQQPKTGSWNIKKQGNEKRGTSSKI